MTGWAAVLVMGIEAALPYMIRNARPPASASVMLTKNFLSLPAGMWPHFWLGYALVALVLAHTSSVMGSVMGRSDPAGIWAATFAFFLLFLQVALGLILKSGAGNHRRLRIWHFWSMIGFVGLVVTHLVRNG